MTDRVWIVTMTDMALTVTNIERMVIKWIFSRIAR